MSNSKLTDLQEQVFGNKKEYNLLDIYHQLMMTYGYFSFEEFKKMDAYLVDELTRRINDDNERANKEIGGKK